MLLLIPPATWALWAPGPLWAQQGGYAIKKPMVFFAGPLFLALGFFHGGRLVGLMSELPAGCLHIKFGALGPLRGAQRRVIG